MAPRAIRHDGGDLTMFVLDPFDIAPQARRYTPAAWILLAVSVIFAMATATALVRTWKQAAVAADAASNARQALRAQTLSEAALADEAARKPSEGVRARLELQRVLNVSWSGLFEMLEGATKAVEGRVTITALAPVRLRPEGAEVGITALAATTDAMLQYLQTLQADMRVRQVQLVAQQTTSLGGAPVIRFQATLLLDRPMRGLPSVTDRTTHTLLGRTE
jgi:hypothetical protein